MYYSNKEVAILVKGKRTHLQHKSLFCNTAVEKRIVEKQTKTKKHCLFPCPGHAYRNALLKGRPSYDTHLGCYYICPKQPFLVFLGHYFSWSKLSSSVQYSVFFQATFVCKILVWFNHLSTCVVVIICSRNVQIENLVDSYAAAIC